MAMQTIERCPHCNKTYQIYNTYTRKYIVQSTGSPFVKCKYCGGTFIDKHIKEPAFKPMVKIKWYHPLLAFLFPFGIFGFFLIIELIFDLNFILSNSTLNRIILIMQLCSLLFYLIGTIYSFSKKNEIQQSICEEYNNSVERLNDDKYIKSLININYKFPANFKQTDRYINIIKSIKAEATVKEQIKTQAKKEYDLKIKQAKEMKKNGTYVSQFSDDA